MAYMKRYREQVEALQEHSIEYLEYMEDMAEVLTEYLAEDGVRLSRSVDLWDMPTTFTEACIEEAERLVERVTKLGHSLCNSLNAEFCDDSYDDLFGLVSIPIYATPKIPTEEVAELAFFFVVGLLELERGFLRVHPELSEALSKPEKEV